MRHWDTLSLIWRKTMNSILRRSRLAEFGNMAEALTKTNMADFKYREKLLEFRSNISKEDVKNAEQVLIDNGIEPDEAQTVLQAIGYTLLDLEIYDEGEEKELPKKKQKFTFRFHTHGWTDITVEAEDAEEAAELASDKYNNGDYDDSDSDFENTDMENVTDYYVENNIPQ